MEKIKRRTSNVLTDLRHVEFGRDLEVFTTDDRGLCTKMPTNADLDNRNPEAITERTLGMDMPVSAALIAAIDCQDSWKF